MILRNLIHLATVGALVALAAGGCSRDTAGLPPAGASTNPIVFDDDFSEGLDFQAFMWSDTDALSMDTDVAYRGTTSLRVDVPGPGAFAGGAFVTYAGRDLTGYNALTFYAKASRADTLDIVGLGNNNTGTSKYEASWSTIPLGTEWNKYVVPIPLPARLAVEQGLFFFAEAVPDDSTAYEIWFDDVMFEDLGTISNPRPSMTEETQEPFVGSTVNVKGTQTIFNVGGGDQTIKHFPGYFTFTSSDGDIAAISDGEIRVVGVGTATITAKLDTVDVEGTVTLNTTAAPTVPAPTPTVPADDVICLFSNAPGYVNVPVDTWAATWSGASHEVADIKIAGDDVKVYTNLLTFAAIEFASQTIDATAMTHFHMDIWVPAGTYFKVKLVDFGEDGTHGGAPDSEDEVTFNDTSTPPLVTEEWVSLEMSLADDFPGLMSTEHLAQLLISGNTQTVYVDNVYFHR
jgi:hypothetical protein